jgi:hypothetical protein
MAGFAFLLLGIGICMAKLDKSPPRALNDVILIEKAGQ